MPRRLRSGTIPGVDCSLIATHGELAMNNGRIASLVLAAIIVVVIVWFTFGRSAEGDRPGVPSPHAIDQSQ